MKLFNLPDLGEGLADAEIREWRVQVGDVVAVDQPLVCMETAKAIVEVPSPSAGRIAKLYGKIGDVIKTGSPLIEFADESEQGVKKDPGSVVGNLEEGTHFLDERDVIVGVKQKNTSALKAMPAVRALAKQFNIDLSTVTPSGPQGQITLDDVKKRVSGDDTGALHGVRRAMAMTMARSHQEVVPVTIMDDVDISHFSEQTDVTVRLIQAMVAGVHAVPALNAWFDGEKMALKILPDIHIGLAIDTEAGLFVPVLKNVNEMDEKKCRAEINALKQSAHARTLTPSQFQEATMSLSNFGMLAGRYANPIVVPPMVAILGCGRARDAVIVRDGKMEIGRILPLSLTVDHRAVTGGEATRFLAAVIKHLEEKKIV